MRRWHRKTCCMSLRAVLEFKARLKHKKLRIHVTQGDRLDPSSNRRDKRIILIIKTGQNIRDQFFVVKFFPVDAISSANVFIFETYSAAEEEPFWVVASAMRVLMTRARD
jgi:hypothetical protein